MNNELIKSIREKHKDLLDELHNKTPRSSTIISNPTPSEQVNNITIAPNSIYDEIFETQSNTIAPNNTDASNTRNDCENSTIAILESILVTLEQILELLETVKKPNHLDFLDESYKYRFGL